MNQFCAITALVIALSTASCGAWYQQFKDNPIVFVDDFMAKTNIIVADLQQTFDDIVPMLPADKQADVRKRFNQALTTLMNAEKALRAGVDAAVVAQQSRPDWGRLVADVVSAVQAIANIVDTFRVPGSKAIGDDAFYARYVQTYGHRP